MPVHDTARFHVASGPESLFARVRQVMDEPRELKVHAPHLRRRAAERGAPLERLDRFDPGTWELVMAEVRRDTGRFVSTTWRVVVGGGHWWVVVGLHDTIVTVIDVEEWRRGFGDRIVRDGELFERVGRLNAGLVAAAAPARGPAAAVGGDCGIAAVPGGGVPGKP
ncbi:hypothetical protein [Streptomyces thermolineatus]|uniref:hypothetical protein n=1 Tax=Streptomyces thermolineatus TaxID=44033 RepID=UPI00384DBF59